MDFSQFSDKELKELYYISYDLENTDNEMLLKMYNDDHIHVYGEELKFLPVEVLNSINNAIQYEALRRFFREDD